MQDEESKQKLIEKCQVKRDLYRVLGKEAGDIHKQSDS
jgi:hypothetical protein